MSAPGVGIACSGEGRKWTGGTGRAICPVCHRGVTAITGVRVTGKASDPASVQRRFGMVPAHNMRGQ